MERMKSLAKITRFYLENNRSKIDLPFMFQFPNSCCETATLILGYILKKEFPENNFSVIKAENHEMPARHFWLKTNSIIFDITSDQFSGIKKPIIGALENQHLQDFNIYEEKEVLQELESQNNHWKSRLDIWLPRLYEEILLQEKLLNQRI